MDEVYGLYTPCSLPTKHKHPTVTPHIVKTSCLGWLSLAMTNKTKSNLERFLKRFMLAHIIKGDQVRRYRYELETETSGGRV